MTVAIRPAVLTDVPAMISIEQQAPGAAHWSLAEYERLVGAEMVLVAEQAGRLCGFVCAKDVAREWEIENVVVAADSLRQGIASALLRALIQRAKAAAAAAMFLEVRNSNAPARRLYEKYSFEEQGRRRAYYQNPVEDAILYVLRLNR